MVNLPDLTRIFVPTGKRESVPLKDTTYAPLRRVDENALHGAIIVLAGKYGR
jgi:hypothetical protein